MIFLKDILIRDLSNSSREVRTYAIKTLSSIHDKEVLNELKAMKSDDDWIVKLYLIKALSLFDKEEVKDTLEVLKKDKDSDVRESANKLLSQLSYPS
jgi:HEAT repeat protein